MDFQAPPPPITGSGLDLEGINQTFGAWQHTDNKRYLIDASRPMYVAAGSAIPNGTMKGVIVTRDQKNVQNGPLSHITSTTDVFNDANAVSAHHNTILCYEYYRTVFNRNSINGSGGTINVVVNVPEEGQAMDNAYWSGSSMYWGNGKDYFSPLAKSLDVTGHEMTHGVVQETAGLIYEGESGALNESFADVFAVMIDRDDWAIGDGIMLPGVSQTGFLRDFVDPHNGGGDWYQPKHYSEKATGSEDNGGVHANSGITNHAFYLFVNNPAVGKEIAEQVYYYTLRDRLTASSKFIDLRLAIIAEATEFYNADVVNAASSAFDQVGITSGAPHLAATPLAPGTGKDYIISVSNDEQYLDIYGPDGTFLTTIYEEGVLDRPSVSDNGEQIVFVNFANQIVGVEIAYNDGSIQFNAGIVSEDSTWRNAAISKDGRFLAALTTLNDNKVIFFDLADPTGPTPREYFLVNPTNVQGVEWIDNVEYADVIEFDYSGTQLIYDAYSNIENADGDDISHWDIGLLKFWKDGEYTPNDAPEIRKLVSQLPEGVGVADPAFSKNSANLIAYDYYQDLPTGGTEYLTYVANIETGDNGPVVSNGTELGYPCFTTKDDKVLFQDKSLIGGNNMRIQPLKPNQVEPSGNPGNIILAHKWGTWLNNSSRVLTVGTHDAMKEQLAFSVSPNPTSGYAQINLSVLKAIEAQLSVINLLGRS
ncbi:MAG: M4 family metallopeptidase [Lewinellaceae bacterium]|nr:M4 family metallopeptidase [Lewinellaceae bacterium]